MGIAALNPSYDYVAMTVGFVGWVERSDTHQTQMPGNRYCST